MVSNNGGATAWPTMATRVALISKPAFTPSASQSARKAEEGFGRLSDAQVLVGGRRHLAPASSPHHQPDPEPGRHSRPHAHLLHARLDQAYWALAGYQGCSVGHKYPTDVNVLRAALELRGLRVSEPVRVVKSIL